MLNKTNEAVNILLEFLNADNQGLSREILVSNEAYKEFRKIIKIILTNNDGFCNFLDEDIKRILMKNHGRKR